LASAFQGFLGDARGAGSAAARSIQALAPRLTETAEQAYRDTRAAQDLTRFRGAVQAASAGRRSAVQDTLENLKKQARLGYDTAKRSLDSQRVALGLPTESTEFQRNIGEAYYRNYLPVEAQALALRSANIERDLEAERALKNLELGAAAQGASAAAQLASARTFPYMTQLDALGRYGSLLSSSIPLAERGYYNFVLGDDGLPELAVATPSYSLPAVYDASPDIARAFSALSAATLSSPEPVSFGVPEIRSDLGLTPDQAFQVLWGYPPSAATPSAATPSVSRPSVPSASERVQAELGRLAGVYGPDVTRYTLPPDFYDYAPARQLIMLGQAERARNADPTLFE